jgi:hypothetical protein
MLPVRIDHDGMAAAGAGYKTLTISPGYIGFHHHGSPQLND